MVLWINFIWNNSFINPTQLPLLCEKTGTLAIMEPGLMAGRQAGRPLGSRNCCKVRKFKFCVFDL